MFPTIGTFTKGEGAAGYDEIDRKSEVHFYVSAWMPDLAALNFLEERQKFWVSFRDYVHLTNDGADPKMVCTDALQVDGYHGTLRQERQIPLFYSNQTMS